MKLHKYWGTLNGERPCTICGQKMYDGQHYKNIGKPCDKDTGPCACGAYHTGEDYLDVKDHTTIRRKNGKHG